MDEPRGFYLERVKAPAHTGPIPPNFFTPIDTGIAEFICSKFDQATLAQWPEDQVVEVRLPEEPLRLEDGTALIPDDIKASLNKFKKFHHDPAADEMQREYDNSRLTHIALSVKQIFALKEHLEGIEKIRTKPTGRIFPGKQTNDTLLKTQKLIAQPEAFAILDAICKPIPPENILIRPEIKAERRSAYGWECYTTDNPKKFIATIYLTTTLKLAVLPLLDKLKEIFRHKSFKCATSVYKSGDINHQVLQIEYDLDSLRKLDVKEMWHLVNNSFILTKAPPFIPTQKEVTCIDPTFTQKDLVVLKFALAQPHNPANKDTHLFQFGYNDCLKTQNGDLSIAQSEICEIFRKFSAACHDELTDYMQQIFDILNAEKTTYRKRKFHNQCAESDLFKFLAQILDPAIPLCADLSSVMVLSAQQLKILESIFKAQNALIADLGEIIHVRTKEGFPSRIKMVNPIDAKETFEILEQLSAPIPSQNIYLRQIKNRSERGWECYTTDNPNLFVATLYFTGINSIQDLATLFQSHDIPAEILPVKINDKNYPTLGIAFDTQSLCSLNIVRLRGEIETFVKPKPAAASGAPHTTHFRPTAVDRNPQAQQRPQSGKSSQQKKSSKK